MTAVTDTLAQLRGTRVGGALAARSPYVPGRGPDFFTDPRRRCAPERGDADLWTSEKPSEVNRAARLCRKHCPVREACAAWADERGEKFGVWGGVNRGPESRRRRHGKKAAPKPVERRPVPKAFVDEVLSHKGPFFAQLSTGEKALALRGALERGMTYPQLAQRLQHPISVLQRIAEPDKPTFDDQVRELYGQGLSDSAMAEALGTNKQSVGASRRAQGLPPKLPRGRPRKVVVQCESTSHEAASLMPTEEIEVQV